MTCDGVTYSRLEGLITFLTSLTDTNWLLKLREALLQAIGTSALSHALFRQTLNSLIRKKADLNWTNT